MRSIALILSLYFSVITATPAMCSTYSVLKQASLCCTEQKCSKDKTDDCKKENGTCTPCCLMQNCCHTFVSIPEFNFIIRSLNTPRKIPAKNDKVLSDYLSECWHPPEID